MKKTTVFILLIVFLSGCVVVKNEKLVQIPEKPIQIPEIERLPNGLIKTDQFKEIDEYARNVPESETNSVRKLVSYLSIKAKTDIEKARAIYIWITNNITYDVDGLFSGNYGDLSADGCLSSRKSVCSGYSNLFEKIGNEMNLNVKSISGFAKGYGYKTGQQSNFKTNHAWNVVNINQKWYFIDSTWGAGSVNSKGAFVKKFEEFYFLTLPEYFICKHFPEVDRWQMLEKPISFDDFLQASNLNQTFFDYGIKEKSHKRSEIVAKQRIDMQLTSPENVLLIAQLITPNNKIDKNLVFVQKEGTTHTIKMEFPTVGKYKINLFAKTKEESGKFYQGVAEYIINATEGCGVNCGFPTTFGNFGTQDILLYEPLKKTLDINSTVHFKLKSPMLQKIFVRMGQEFVELKKNGEIFEGNVLIKNKEIFLLSQLQSSSYNVLLQFEGN
ncbi:MAG: transglutaminase domain-containing protein [Paludibacter sp.]